MRRNRFDWLLLALCAAAACSAPAPRETADLIVKGRVYTLSWDEPALDGTPAPSAPHGADGWKPDAEAVAIRDGRILAVGTADEIAAYAGESTQTLDASGATVIPGLIDSHTHVAGLGELESQVSLFGVKTEEEAVQRVVDAAVQLLGGRGLVATHPVDRLYRAVRALRIYEGTTEIQRLLIAGALLSPSSKHPAPSSHP